MWSIIQDLPTAASANALPRPDPPASEHLSSTAQPPVLPLPSLASTSCSTPEAHCGLMGLTFLVKSQGKSWKCPGLVVLFLASWSPLGTVLSAREAQSFWWVTGLEAGPDPRNICLCVILRASQAAVKLRGLQEAAWGEPRQSKGDKEFLEESPSALPASYTPENTLRDLGQWFYKLISNVLKIFSKWNRVQYLTHKTGENPCWARTLFLIVTS